MRAKTIRPRDKGGLLVDQELGHKVNGGVRARDKAIAVKGAISLRL